MPVSLMYVACDQFTLIRHGRFTDTRALNLQSATKIDSKIQRSKIGVYVSFGVLRTNVEITFQTERHFVPLSHVKWYH